MVDRHTIEKGSSSTAGNLKRIIVDRDCASTSHSMRLGRGVVLVWYVLRFAKIVTIFVLRSEDFVLRSEDLQKTSRGKIARRQNKISGPQDKIGGPQDKIGGRQEGKSAYS